MTSKTKAWLAAIIVLIALCVWSRCLWHPRPHNEEKLRDTSGIEVTALGIKPVAGGFHVACRIANLRRQYAEQVVFQVSLVGPDGRILAVNPLANASAIPAGETRELAVLVPAATEVSNVSPRVQTSLVRWKD